MMQNGGLRNSFRALLGICFCVMLLSVSSEAARPDADGQYTWTLNAESGTDITAQLNDALEKAGNSASDNYRVRVRVSPGEYYVSSVLHIYSNTILDCTDVTLTKKGKSGNMIMAGTNEVYRGIKQYNKSSACAGYNGHKNIVLRGGIWKGSSSCTSTIMRMAHVNNLALLDLTVTGGACSHQVEVAAINGFCADNCRFGNFGTPSAKTNQEAIQLDIPCSSQVFKNTYLDGTPNKNVEITNCVFENVNRGVGTHTKLVGAYHENILIENNTFTNIREEAIVCFDYYDCIIRGNELVNCGAGILFQYGRASQKYYFSTIFDGKEKYTGEIRTDARTEISGNSIRTYYNDTVDLVNAIQICGYDGTSNLKGKKGKDGAAIPANNYYVAGLEIKDNTIITAGDGILLHDVKGCTISGNSIRGFNYVSRDPKMSKHDGISIRKKSENILLNEANTIISVTRHGILLTDGSCVTGILNHSIRNCGRYGIALTNKSKCIGEIAKEQAKGCAAGAVYIGAGSKVEPIVEEPEVPETSSPAPGGNPGWNIWRPWW